VILILGSREFYQVGKVISCLETKGEKIKVIDLCSDNIINADFSSGFDSFYFDGDKVDLKGLNVTWGTTKFLYEQFGDSQKWVDDLTRMTMKKTANYNIFSLFTSQIVNPYSVDIYSNHKLLQLKLAKKIGFLIPDSLVSNDISQIIKWKKKRACIIKSLASSAIPFLKDGVKQKSVMTVELDDSYLEGNPDKIEPFPIFAQEKINKKFEYRVVFVHGKTFSFRIDPYQHSIMNVDYRMGGRMVDYQPTSLPPLVEDKIKRFADAIQLFSGCFDLIEDMKGDFVFLEVNPDGVWGHHDDIMEGKISEAFASSLIDLNS